MENKIIDIKKFNSYTNMKEVKDIFVGSPVYVPLLEFDRTRAEQALKFLKARLNDDEFEFIHATPAIIQAIEALEEFEKELKEEEAKIIKDRKDKATLKRNASAEAKDLIDKKIEPLFNELIGELKNMNMIYGFEDYMWLDQRSRLFWKLKEVILIH